MNHAHLLGRVAQTQGMARTKALRQEAGHMLGMAREQQGGQWTGSEGAWWTPEVRGEAGRKGSRPCSPEGEL